MKYCIHRYQTESSSLKYFFPRCTNITNIANNYNITNIVNITNIANIANIGNILNIVNIADIADIVPMPNFDPPGIFHPIPPLQLPGKEKNIKIKYILLEI